MAVQRAKYWRNKNVYHFETDDKAVKVLDNNNNELGTLRELMFQGKPKSNISYRDIKQTGVYLVKGFKDGDLSGKGVPNDKNCILSVLAVGENPNNPDVLSYKIITPDGVVLQNTVSGSSSTGWNEGGVNLKNQINSINAGIGEVRNLQTKNKQLTDAVNEVNRNIAQETVSRQALENRFNSHNHDSRYVLKNGDTMGQLTVKNQMWITKDGRKGYLGMSGNDFVVGDKTSNLKLQGQSGTLYYNGRRVVTVGDGQPVNADTVGGKKASAFVLKDGDQMTGNLTMGADAPIVFKDEHWQDKASLAYYNQAFRINSGQGSFAVGDNGIEMNGRINLNNNLINYDGMIHASNGAKNIQFGFGGAKECVWIASSPYIGDHQRRLFLQDETPGGPSDIPEGSVWIGR